MIYGWDVSTSIVGCAIFTDECKFISAHHLDLRDHDGLLAKADAFKTWLTDIGINKGETNYHFIEERLGGFSGGRTSAQVLMKLASFNAICSYIIWTHDAPFHAGRHRQVTYLHPSTWKAIMKKEAFSGVEGLVIPKGTKSDVKKLLTLEFVKRREPSFVVEYNRNDKPQPWCFDKADAWCLGRSGWRLLQKQALSTTSSTDETDIVT